MFSAEIERDLAADSRAIVPNPMLRPLNSKFIGGEYSYLLASLKKASDTERFDPGLFLDFLNKG